jgi:hypothetical protein
MGIGELIGMRWVLWDEEGADPIPGARPDVPEDVFEEMMQFIERALAPGPSAAPGPTAAVGPAPDNTGSPAPSPTPSSSRPDEGDTA